LRDNKVYEYGPASDSWLKSTAPTENTTMTSAILPKLLSILLCAAHSHTLTIPSQSSPSLIALPYSATNPTSNLSLPSASQNLSAAPLIRCDRNLYKQDLVRTSCTDALSYIPTDTEILSFGDRGEGIFDIRLPYRWISCGFSISILHILRTLALTEGAADGRCIFQIVKNRHVPAGYANTSEFKTAALMLQDTCLGSEVGSGGIATNIGEFDNPTRTKHDTILHVNV